MTQYVTVRLTQLEADELLHTAGYALEWPPVIDVFGEAKDGSVKDKKRYYAAMRAVKKVRTALTSPLNL